jgi:hypothetical protein
MAFFDSAKNRALWQRELSGLREEKERRAREGYVPGMDRETARDGANPHRIRTSYAQLEMEEYQAQRDLARQKLEERELARERMAAQRQFRQPERTQERQL